MSNVGILVVNRAAFSRLCAENRGGIEPDSLSAQALAYRGFDGIVWPERHLLTEKLTGGLAPVDSVEQIATYLKALEHADECKLLLLSVGEPAPRRVRSQWQPIGFDLGFYESEWSHYSVIANVILRGSLLELRARARVLNGHSLFPNIESALETARIHEKLAAAGADVEVGQMVPIEIHVRNPRGAR